MGAGKSAVSRKLSGLLKRELVSTDQLIEQREGKKIAEIFEKSGEAHFRKLEREIIIEVTKKKDAIIDCGGGIVLNKDNIKDLKENSVLICLSISPETVYQRIKHQKHRPLLEGQDPPQRIKELMNERSHLYSLADYTIATDEKSVDQVCQEILRIVSK